MLHKLELTFFEEILKRKVDAWYSIYDISIQKTKRKRGKKMYLKSLSVYNFRKFYVKDTNEDAVKLGNKVVFVNSQTVPKKKEEDINIAAATTLIVGKNNSGKTTFVEGLRKIVEGTKEFTATDYNFRYLKECLESFKGKQEDIIVPVISFKLIIGLEENSTDLLTNIVPFMTVKDVDDSDVEINIRYKIVEEENFKRNVIQMLEKNKEKDAAICFDKFIEILNATKCQISYYDRNGRKIEGKFTISDLIEIRPIKANRLKDEHILSETFNKIVKHQHENKLEGDIEEINNNFEKATDIINKNVKKHHTKLVDEVIHKMVSLEHMGVNLHANITLDKLLNKLIEYQYVENEYNIPENQFGLGYTNLMMVVAEILDYMEKYPNTSFNSKINLISIEEPETFMHPQMQELFMKNINDVINLLLRSHEKHINSQIIITTHSSHILNSKIQTGNSFNSINYIGEKSGQPYVVTLADELVKPPVERQDISEEKKSVEVVKEEEKQNFILLKKYIKYKMAELFFAEAIILVEGMTEDTLLPFYLENESKLNKRYVCIFNINGAYGHIYSNLLKALKIPTLIITDLDIEREKKEAEKDEKEQKAKDCSQITSLTDKKTTNGAIKFFWGKDISNIGKLKLVGENIYLACQNEAINGYYATSFEEAFILENYDNDILNDVLKEIKPRIYANIVGKDRKNNIEKSYIWQEKLTEAKSEFASKVLFSMIDSKKEDRPNLPAYIQKGFEWLVNQVEGM